MAGQPSRNSPWSPDYTALNEAHARAYQGAEAVGLGDFDAIGQAELHCLQRYGLEPHHALLDFGCGAGRLAQFAIPYLSRGRYVGLDISPTMIDRAKKLCEPVTGSCDVIWTLQGAAQWPYPDHSFDMVCAFSVFGHMEHEDTFRYLKEASRVMTARGRLVLTCLPIDTRLGAEIFLQSASETLAERWAHVRNIVTSRELVETVARMAGWEPLVWETAHERETLCVLEKAGGRMSFGQFERASAEAVEPAPVLETHGGLDNIQLEPDALAIGGWVAGSLAAVDGFAVTCGGTPLDDVELLTGLTSRDVGGMHASCSNPDNCRFSIRAPMPGREAERYRGSVVLVTPFVAGAPGAVMAGVVDPDLPLPGPAEVEAIGGAFLDVSYEFLGYFIQRAGLRPSDDVLDVGCGCGRMAYSLAYYLQPEARYEGFDVAGDLVEWARVNITPRFPHFHFEAVDIRNRWYNPAGAFEPSTYRFPFGDASFDVVLLTSVITHMGAPEARNYLAEAHRVLRPGGRAICTCFLLNEESERLIREGKSSQNIIYPVDDWFTACPEVPEQVVGFEERSLLGWIADCGLTVTGKWYGSWCGRDRFTSYQDILVISKA